MKRFQQLYGVALTAKKTQEIVFVLMALEAIFAFSYLGYIELPMLSTTTLHVLVIVAAMILGTEGSVPVVCVFALTSMWIASYATSPLDQLFSPFVSGSPFGSLMLVAARVLFAVLASWGFGLWFSRPRRHIYLGIAALAVLDTILHGLIVLGAYYTFFPWMRQELAANMLFFPLFRDWFSYVSAAAVCCGVHFVLSKQKVRDDLASLCENAGPVRENNYQKVLAVAKLGTGIVGILCVLYLRKQIFHVLLAQNAVLPGTVYLNITAFLVQLLVAFVCLFGIVSVVVRWINEFYTIRQKKLDEKLNEQSVKISIDALTGVCSRMAYHEAIESYAEHIPEDLAVFLIDINGLKRVNDTLGHEAGDELICGAAHCITEAVGDKGRTFRIGGDEFVVFAAMQKAQADETLAEMDRIMAAWSGVKVKALSVSAGYALANEFAGCSVEELTKEADKAMYEQKKNTTGESRQSEAPATGRKMKGAHRQ